MKRIKNLIVGIVCISLVIGLYYFVSHRNSSTAEEETEVTEVQKLILKDLEDKSYPETPRAVVKLYTRIQSCFYNEEYTDEEFKQLAEQARYLLDAELLENNPEEIYEMTLQADIKDFKDNSRTISNVKLSESNDVIYKTVGKRDCAYVNASYFLRDVSGFSKTIQKYVLRKDENERWKVLAFELKEGDIDE